MMRPSDRCPDLTEPRGREGARRRATRYSHASKEHVGLELARNEDANKIIFG
jgi:hypothetical protein